MTCITSCATAVSCLWIWAARTKLRSIAWKLAPGLPASTAYSIINWPPSPECPYAHRAYIHNVYTAPEFRRRGLARRLMETMVAWCRAKPCEYVSLHAAGMGRPLCQAMGFQPTREMRFYFA